MTSRTRRAKTLCRVWIAAAVLALAVLGSAASSASASTTFTGRFVCQDRGEELPLAGASVSIDSVLQSGPILGIFPGPDPFSFTRGTALTGPDGDWSFTVPDRGQDGYRSNFTVTVSLDDQAGTVVSDWPNAGPTSFPQGSNQNDREVQDYHTVALPGGQCPLFLALKRAREDYERAMGRPAPFGVVHAEYGDGPSLGFPYTAYNTIIWPQDYPIGPGPGSQVHAIHEFAHLVRNASLGSRSAFLDEVSQFDYRRRRDVCRRTSPRYAFHEGWAEYWAGDFLPAPCPATQADAAVEGDVAWTLTRLERSCQRRRLVDVLLARGRSIHSIDDFQRALGSSCVEAPLDPGTVPRSPISNPVRAGSWITDVRSALRTARGGASRLTTQLSTVKRAARHTPCPRVPCFQALERRVAPAIVAGMLAQARLLASTLSTQISARSRRLAVGRPTRAFLDRLLATPRRLASGMASIGVRSLDRALLAGRSIIRRDHSAQTLQVVRALRAERTAFARARRRGTLLPISFGLTGARLPKMPVVPTTRLIRFDGFPGGTLITTQAAGVAFGSAAALGFKIPQPAHTCPDGVTASGGAAVAPDCPASISGLRDNGALAHLASPARNVKVSIGSTLAVPGGFAANLEGFDAQGHSVTRNAVLVGSSTNGQGAGPVQSLEIQALGSAAPIAYVALFFDGSTGSGARLVFDDLALSAP